MVLHARESAPLQARYGLVGELWGYVPALGELLGELWEIIFLEGSTTQQSTHVLAALTLTWQAAALAKRRWGPRAQSSVFLVSSRQTPATS